MAEEKTCKQCEHYQFYDGPEKPREGTKAVMKCTSSERRERLEVDGHIYSGIYDNIARPPCSNFTPKKLEPEKSCENCYLSSYNNNNVGCMLHPEKPDGSCPPNYKHWRPIPKEPEKTVVDCNETCKYSWKNNPSGEACCVAYPKENAKCEAGGRHLNWTPCESKKPKETEKPIEKVCSTCGADGSSIFNEPCYSCLSGSGVRNWRPKDKSVESDPGIGQSSGGTLSDCQTKTFYIDGSKIKAQLITKEQYERFNHQQKTPNRKERSMWNKVVHLIRMSVLVLCLVGMFTVGSFINPKLIWLADVVKPLGDKTVQLESGDYIMMKMSYGDNFLAVPGTDNFSVWITLMLAIAAIIVIPYLLHIATLKLFNVNRKK